jgi:hypothetical protein
MGSLSLNVGKTRVIGGFVQMPVAFFSSNGKSQ